MNDNQTLRLVFPQWQGGGPIADFVPELPAEDAYKGYFLGVQLLSYLAPEAKGKTIHIPVSLDIADRAEKMRLSETPRPHSMPLKNRTRSAL